MRRLLRRLRSRSERGGVAVEFMIGVPLFLIPTTMLCIALPTWVERESLSRTAAREAARVYVLSSDHASGVANAEAAVARIAENAEIPPSALELQSITGATPGSRGGSAVARVTVVLPALVVPTGDSTDITADAGYSITSSHREHFDRFRTVGGTQ